jgi:hypothetical protein
MGSVRIRVAQVTVEERGNIHKSAEISHGIKDTERQAIERIPLTRTGHCNSDMYSMIYLNS